MFDAVDARRAAQKNQGPQQAAGGAGGRTTFDALLAADDAWARMRGAASTPAGASSFAPPTMTSSPPPTQFVRLAQPYEPLLRLGRAPPPQQQFDVVICGGTLGVFLAAALAKRCQGQLRVAVVERASLQGREQEWNLSRAELRALVRAGAFDSEEDAERAVVSEFNPVRVGFYDSWSSSSKAGGSSRDVWARDVLNLGVSPDALVQAARRSLEKRGGRVFERAAVDGLDVHPDAVAMRVRGGGLVASGGEAAATTSGGGNNNNNNPLLLSAKLVVDCMGHGSPAARQLRHGRKPDGVCLVVGGCADGFDPEGNKTADVIATASDTQSVGGTPAQLFWEAFPAAAAAASDGGGEKNDDKSTRRTTYMFAYMDASAWRPSLLAMFEAYWKLMPAYQRGAIGKGGGGGGGGEKSDGAANAADAADENNSTTETLDHLLFQQLTFERLLFGVFPTYRDSPLKPGFDRVLQVGDASGVQSPLSFGGLAALARHLPRLVAGLDDALATGQVTQEGLGLLAPYMPNLSAAWMLQRAMTAAKGRGGGIGGGGESGGGNNNNNHHHNNNNNNNHNNNTTTPQYTTAPPNLINRMLGGNFQAMAKLGDRVSKPFLQDVLRPGGLLLTLTAQMTADPLFVPPLLMHLGPGPLADFTRHFAAMAAYDLLYRVVGPGVRFLAGEGSCRGGGLGAGGGGGEEDGGGWLGRHGQAVGVPASVGYQLRRQLDAWKYGSGMDYEFD
jgi:hypothetical protein